MLPITSSLAFPVSSILKIYPQIDYFSPHPCSILVQATIISCWIYQPSLPTDFPVFALKILQSVQNVAARLLLLTHEWHQVSLLLKSPSGFSRHWAQQPESFWWPSQPPCSLALLLLPSSFIHLLLPQWFLHQGLWPHLKSSFPDIPSGGNCGLLSIYHYLPNDMFNCIFLSVVTHTRQLSIVQVAVLSIPFIPVWTVIKTQ